MHLTICFLGLFDKCIFYESLINEKNIIFKILAAVNTNL